MKTLRLALNFSTDEFLSPVARIYVAGKFPREKDTLTYLTPDCVSESELDEAIESIRKELTIISDEAHRKFAAERTKSSAQT
jgi:hypothetical protein